MAVANGQLVTKSFQQPRIDDVYQFMLSFRYSSTERFRREAASKAGVRGAPPLCLQALLAVAVHASDNGGQSMRS